MPGRVARIASQLRPELAAFESVRERPGLLLKRLGTGGIDQKAQRVRRVLSGTPPIRARVTDFDTFDDPPRGAAPVLYLHVESPGVREVHATLVEEFGAVEGLEGEGYTPHFTLARGGAEDVAERLVDRDIDPVEWTITELEIYDATHKEPARRISLPA